MIGSAFWRTWAEDFGGDLPDFAVAQAAWELLWSFGAQFVGVRREEGIL